PVAKATLRSAGPPRKIRLAVDRSKIRADRSDLAYVTVQVVDAAGNQVPNATIPVRFSIKGAGELAAVANSHPADAASFRIPIRNTFQGRCLAIVRPLGQSGKITLRAEAEGLASAETVIHAR
ncbi:MAG TPA: glycoside hydrolase family 2, partial [Clostridia bacterium]|nr:glycoside hydrolase family 2 [Clostridia bacterium]